MKFNGHCVCCRWISFGQVFWNTGSRFKLQRNAEIVSQCLPVFDEGNIYIDNKCWQLRIGILNPVTSVNTAPFIFTTIFFTFLKVLAIMDIGMSFVLPGVLKLTTYGIVGRRSHVGLSSKTGTLSSVIPSIGPLDGKLLSVIVKPFLSSWFIICSSPLTLEQSVKNSSCFDFFCAKSSVLNICFVIFFMKQSSKSCLTSVDWHSKV